jgi:histidyl-tRNA synthetase
VQIDADGRSPKSQMKRADRTGARFVLLVGSDEVARGEVTVKEMATSLQQAVRRSELGDWLRARVAGQ